MKRLFFIRHGLTEMNVDGRFAGQTETPLVKEGKQQAKQAGQHMLDNHPKMDVIICSPYERTFHTAEIIAQEIGYDVSRIEKNPLFIERSFGVLEGTSSKDFFRDKEYMQIDETENAETIEQLQLRAQQALEYVKSRKEDNILVVSHGGFGRAFRRAVQKLPHTHEYEKFEPIANAEIIELI